MELTEGSETSAYISRTPGNYPKGNLLYEQRNCPKHVEFYSKNKCEKLVHLVGFIIRIYQMLHGHLNVKGTKIRLIVHHNKFLFTHICSFLIQIGSCTVKYIGRWGKCRNM